MTTLLPYLALNNSAQHESPGLSPICMGGCHAGQGKTPSFRLDKQALEATTTRQLQVRKEKKRPHLSALSKQGAW